MGVCMGKDSSSLLPTQLEPDGRFTSQFEPLKTAGGGGAGESASVRFSEPRVPVIFILGGPGSGKITHCDRVVQERQGLAHVNMTDLVQQHVIGNGLEDFTQMPASNLIQVLQMEMKMTVNATCYLISGYPRSMRDVVEYNEKLRRVDAVILLNWHIRILEKQIEFGSQLGDTVLQLARMELRNYVKNVLAVADYFDQMHRLLVVDGERQPTEVYNDFLAAIDNVLQQGNVPLAPMKVPPEKFEKQQQAASHLITNNKLMKMLPSTTERRTCWIIGGPGSNKSLLSSSPRFPWVHLSIGGYLRSLSSPSGAAAGTALGLTQDQLTSIRNTLRRGELVSNDIVLRIVYDFLKKHQLVVIDGFPRNAEQLAAFERDVGLKPPCILIDCSEVELGRSLGQRNAKGTRTDNSSDAIKSRLMTYRLTTLPTLKALDDQQRLHIVDGDGDPSKVVSEFTATFNDVLNALEFADGRKPSTDTIKAMYNELLGD